MCPLMSEAEILMWVVRYGSSGEVGRCGEMSEESLPDR